MENQKKTILLVEDNNMAVLVETKILDRFGYNVVVAKTGEEAVQVAISNEQISLVLMDIELGAGIDGAEATKQILLKRNLPVVFLTEHTEKEYADRIRGIAGYGYVPKSSGGIVLQSSIEMALSLFEAELALRKNETKYHNLIEATCTGFVVLDRIGRVIDANAEYVRLSGYNNLSEIMGRSVIEWTEIRSQNKNTMALDKCARDRMTQDLEIDYVNADGKITPVEINATAEGEGDALHIISLCRDITERKYTESTLIRANGILSVECDVARNMAAGKDGGLDAVLCKAGRKLGVRWLCVVMVNDGGVVGRWTDESGSSINSIDLLAKYDIQDIEELRKWIAFKKSYVGNRDEMPPCLLKLSKSISGNGNWLAIPVDGDKPHSLMGTVMVLAKNGRKWSSNECDAMSGLATMFCILAKNEKNREELSRKINSTITDISSVGSLVKDNLGVQNVK